MMMVLGLFEIVFLIVTYFTIRSFLKEKERSQRIVYGVVSLFFVYLTLFEMPNLMLNMHNEGTKAVQEVSKN